MGFCFYRPIIDNQAGTYRTDGLVTSASMLSNVNQMYMGDQLVYPYVPFSSSGIVAWWRGDQNVVSSSATFYWSTYYSNTTSSFTLTGSGVAGSDYNTLFSPGYQTGSVHKALYDGGGSYVYVDLNNIFTTSSNISIVVAGRSSRGLSNPFVYKSWFGMTGDWNSYIGTSAQSISNTNYVLKRDEDATPSVWFGQGLASAVLTSFSYNGTTGDYSYYMNNGSGGTVSGSSAGATGRLGPTQQLRIGGWDGTLFQTFIIYDIIVLNYIPSTVELNTWSAFCANNYVTIYTS